MIDLFQPFVPREAVEAVSDVLRSRWIGQGPKVEAFEKAFAKKFDWCGRPVSVSSGTAALETAYELVGIKPGDEVITTPLTCTATNLLLLRMGAKIVFADIDLKTLCIDPEDVARKLTARTKAVVQVHLGGIQAQVKNVVTDRGDGIPHRVPIISDAAQALGVFCGDYTCCSFQAIKHITTGDGGMIICSTEEDEHKAKLLRWFGIDRAKKVANNWQSYRERAMTFDIELPGTKRHMTDIAAAMGLVGLDYYDRVLNHRGELFNLYRENLRGVDGIILLDGPNNTYWLATVLVERRDQFAKAMFEAGIDTNMVQVRNDIYKIFGGERQDLPNMNKVEQHYLCLPIGMHVSFDDVQFICDTIKRGW